MREKKSVKSEDERRTKDETRSHTDRRTVISSKTEGSTTGTKDWFERKWSM